MSDISVLSKQYEQIAKTSDDLNNSIIAFKKSRIMDSADYIKKYPKLKLEEKDLIIAKEILEKFLESITTLLLEKQKNSDVIPSIILDDYQRELLSIPGMIENINLIINILKRREKLTDEQLSTLDTILILLDNERRKLFKKLRSARGW